jgi:hypothetical protein
LKYYHENVDNVETISQESAQSLSLYLMENKTITYLSLGMILRELPILVEDHLTPNQGKLLAYGLLKSTSIIEMDLSKLHDNQMKNRKKQFQGRHCQ